MDFDEDEKFFVLSAEETLKCIKTNVGSETLKKRKMKFDFVKGQALSAEDKAKGLVLASSIWCARAAEALGEGYKLKPGTAFGPNSTCTEIYGNARCGKDSCRGSLSDVIRVSCKYDDFAPGKEIKFTLGMFKCKMCLMGKENKDKKKKPKKRKLYNEDQTGDDSELKKKKESETEISALLTPENSEEFSSMDTIPETVFVGKSPREWMKTRFMTSVKLKLEDAVNDIPEALSDVEFARALDVAGNDAYSAGLAFIVTSFPTLFTQEEVTAAENGNLSSVFEDFVGGISIPNSVIEGEEVSIGRLLIGGNKKKQYTLKDPIKIEPVEQEEMPETEFVNVSEIQEETPEVLTAPTETSAAVSEAENTPAAEATPEIVTTIVTEVFSAPTEPSTTVIEAEKTSAAEPPPVNEAETTSETETMQNVNMTEVEADKTPTPVNEAETTSETEITPEVTNSTSDDSYTYPDTDDSTVEQKTCATLFEQVEIDEAVKSILPPYPSVFF